MHHSTMSGALYSVVDLTNGEIGSVSVSISKITMIIAPDIIESLQFTSCAHLAMAKYMQ